MFSGAKDVAHFSCTAPSALTRTNPVGGVHRFLLFFFFLEPNLHIAMVTAFVTDAAPVWNEITPRAAEWVFYPLSELKSYNFGNVSLEHALVRSNRERERADASITTVNAGDAAQFPFVPGFQLVDE